tara:strand:+ start:105 stop:536 length:432 start_codon:yes stop_codon:yes gene_type:complete
MKKKQVIDYIISLLIVTVVFIYGLNLPTIITGNKILVKEYYYDHFLESLLLDIVLIAIYLNIAFYVFQKLQLKSFLGKLLVVAVVTMLISGGFYLYFIYNKKSSMFFSRWFHTVRHKAVIYDIILISLVFSVYKYIQKYNKLK